MQTAKTASARQLKMNVCLKGRVVIKNTTFKSLIVQIQIDSNWITLIWEEKDFCHCPIGTSPVFNGGFQSAHTATKRIKWSEVKAFLKKTQKTKNLFSNL